MGLNYLDMAPAYNRGDTERASAVISNLWDESFVRENLLIAGKKVELQPA